MQVKTGKSKYVDWVYVALLCVCVSPFLYISQFNHPSADDYCIAVKAKEEGFWYAQSILYTNWSGRFFSTFITSVGPLYFNSFFLVKIIPLFLMFLMLFSVTKLVDELYDYQLKLTQIITFGLSFLVLFLLNVNNLPEAVYSYTSSLPYTLPVLLTVLFLSILFKKMKREVSKYTTVFMYFLLIIIVGSSETTALLMNLFIPYFLLLNKLKEGKLNKVLLSVWFTSFATLLCVMLSPSLIYSFENPMVVGSTTKELVLKGIDVTIKNIEEWMFNTPLLFFSFVMILFSKNYRFDIPCLKKIHPIIHVVVGLIFFTALYVFSFYTIDYDHVTRISVLLFGFFVVWWFLVLYASIHYYHEQEIQLFKFLKKHLFDTISREKYHVANVVAIGIFILFSNNNLRTVVGEVISGQLAMYDRENEIRYKMIEELERTNLLQFTIRPESLYLDDITSDKDAWQNKCYSNFYQLSEGVSLSK